MSGKKFSLVFVVTIIIFFFIRCKTNKQESSIKNKLEMVGDGKRDATQVLQSLLDKGGVIRLPAGVYRTQPLKFSSNTSIEGDGEGTIIQLFFNSPPTTQTLQSVFYAKNIDIGKTSNVVFKNLTIDGSRDNINWKNVRGDGNAHGIATWGTQNLILENLVIKNCWTDGLYFSGTRKSSTFFNAKNCKVKNIAIENCGRQGITVISLENSEFKKIKINNINRTAPRAGIDLEPNRFAPDKIAKLTFNSIKINNTGEGFLISGVSRPENIKISNLQIETLNNGYGIMISNADAISIDSTSVNNINGKSNYPLLWVANSTKVNINNANLHQAKGAFAIEVQSGINTVQTEVNINNVKVTKSKNAGLFVKDKYPKVTITNSEFIDNGENSEYAVLNVNSDKVSFDKVKVKGKVHKSAVKLGVDNVRFDNCEFEEGRTKIIFNKNGYKSKFKNTTAGKKLLKQE